MIWLKVTHSLNKILKFNRLTYYGEERSSMARKAEPIIIESVEYDYIGTDNQFKVFLQSVIKDYLSENRLAPDEGTNLKKSA